MTCALAPGLFGDPTSIASQYTRTTFTIAQGLPDNTINAITQTQNGLLWLGTQSGLSSFDGHHFKSVRLRIPGGLAPLTITSLLEGPSGDLWIGTDAGIARIAKDDLNHPYFAVSTGYPIGKHRSDEVEVLFKSRTGVIWAGTNHGLYRFDGSQFLNALSSIDVSRIEQARNGNLLLITNQGVADYDGRTLRPRSGFDERLGLSNAEIFDAYEDARGIDWYCTPTGVRAVGLGAPARLFPHFPAHTSTFRVYKSPSGDLWFCTGIGVYGLRGDQFQTPLAGVAARVFYASNDGDFWLGTNGSGLVHLRPRRVHVYSQADGMPNDLPMAVLPTRDGKLWIGYNCGVIVKEGGKLRTYRENDGLRNSCIWSLAQDRDGDVWLGSYGGGLFRYHNGNFAQITTSQGLASQIVFSITAALDGSLWLATPDGLSHITYNNAGIRQIRVYTTADGLSSARVLDVHQDHAGAIWVATQAGVNKLRGDRFVHIQAERSGEILGQHFLEDSHGRLYVIDAPHGISRIQNDRIRVVDESIGLISGVESPDHILWFSSRCGIIRIPEAELASYRESSKPLEYQQFDSSDGMLTTEASIGSPNIALTRDGRLWLATVNGLDEMATEVPPNAARPPKLFVAGVMRDGVPDVFHKELSLKPGLHHIELELAAVDLAIPDKIRLQYWMEGVDTRWLDVNSSSAATYTGIPPGKHQLFLRATNSLGKWSPAVAVYAVTQEPYTYETPLFRAAAILLVTMTLLVAYLVRVRHVVLRTRTILEERQLERENVARDLHDTFLQGVQALILRFHTGTQQIPRDHPVRYLFEDALLQSDKVMLEGRCILSRLRVQPDDAQALASALTAVCAELKSEESASFEVIVNGRTRELHALVYAEVRRVGREALFNAFRHSHAANVRVELNYAARDFSLRVSDDGVGIPPAVLREGRLAGHFGLPGMRERITGIRGIFKLTSLPEAGTEIDVRIPAEIAYRQPHSGSRFSRIYRMLRSRMP